MPTSSETMGERRVMKSGERHSPEPENLQCPRCESTNTKFCYYNNYNLTQPRYFCKGCRRYWTRGGSLRNIPVGGGTRKNSKRSRLSASSDPLPLSPAVTDPQADRTEDATPVPFSIKTVPTPVPAMSPFRCSDVNLNLNEALPGSLSSLLGSQQTGGFLGLNGYSLGLGNGPSSGFEMLGFGYGKSAGDWPAVETGSHSVNGEGGSSSGWMIDGGALTEGGDCFGWPDLAISTPGTAGLE